MGAVATIPVCGLSTLTFSLVFFQLTSRCAGGLRARTHAACPL